jgi:Flp pilus assembly protein TadG
VETVLVVPVAMLVVAVGVQLALWAVAGEAAQLAADQAAMAASALGASAAQGQVVAQRVLQRAAVAGHWTVQVVGESGTVVAVVQGQVASVVPGWSPTVQAVRREPRARFRPG